jgi:HAE1 family hydrophobic/amphiphilic exporter-1
MVVDDAIVVLEEHTWHIETGYQSARGSHIPTNSVLSVIISTLVIVAVFFPLTLVVA